MAPAGRMAPDCKEETPMGLANTLAGDGEHGAMAEDTHTYYNHEAQEHPCGAEKIIHPWIACRCCCREGGGISC